MTFVELENMKVGQIGRSKGALGGKGPSSLRYVRRVASEVLTKRGADDILSQSKERAGSETEPQCNALVARVLRRWNAFNVRSVGP